MLCEARISFVTSQTLSKKLHLTSVGTDAHIHMRSIKTEACVNDLSKTSVLEFGDATQLFPPRSTTAKTTPTDSSDVMSPAERHARESLMAFFCVGGSYSVLGAGRWTVVGPF